MLNNMASTCKTIIIGTNHHNTFSMVRCFGEEGQGVILYIYGAQNSYIASSIYVENVFYFPSASHAIETLILLLNKLKEKPVVIACSDEVSSQMDKRYDELIGKCYFFNAGGKGCITSFMDKQKQLCLARECGFLVPSSIDALPNDINTDSVNFPCFVKPKISIYGGKNIAICYTKEDLISAIAQYSPNHNILVQDYLHKEGEIVVLGMSLGDNNIVPGFVQKYREEKGGTTYSIVRPISELHQNIVDACKLLIKKIGYQGLWGIECIKQGDEYFFLEINMRNDATTYSLKVAGVNLPFLYQQLIMYPDKELIIKPVKSIKSMVEFNDFNFVLKRKVGLFEWINDYKQSECKYFHSNVDPKPCARMKREYIYFLFKRIFKI